MNTSQPLTMQDKPRLTQTAPLKRAKVPSPRRIAQRHRMVMAVKYLLPATAALLLTMLAIWPEIDREVDAARVTYRRLTATASSGTRLTGATYRGVDEQNRPYTVTAHAAEQVDQERINLAQPKADATLQNGNWLMVQSKKGVYLQHLGMLDMTGDVTLYRDDGTVMTSQTASLNMHHGAVSSSDKVSVEGPFGTLDASHGFTLLDRGNIMQFHGPSRMVLNAARSSGTTQAKTAP
ncbi:LPS export ABC transporter periplasmic protein LptC [Granulibacter bethesdensis]|uniref:LPS export ABC transporter periplasmic protein LptC n=2 Tax=Granulibacter bethesdensis TaxID=364410 RepID=Q0BUA5_GRABC|nr:LPS export ABC transporter periplasmic protein LptC [Granulibacter bethesdensis]ABI61597.1 Hypothetical protein GbCGDNIH1_0699 [Granulibacter bethesdensis CGDNIH1]AHJ62486.1 Hypothetical protein GbCGDNIH3_0699 [Granulibacter bethesdensis]AHJ65114.1 Hypothetical protein GbCGDNIH4_0699 [Granulibacter bethesdensis CGDNIH4]AHJ67737.1 Hypothetical protein GbCGDNIH2_0699 [Granulibacter bethesdensis]APH51399.1 Hypothetical protein GbCGDNIH5_0699 [Granulibacter bethesdensis]